MAQFTLVEYKARLASDESANSIHQLLKGSHMKLARAGVGIGIAALLLSVVAVVPAVSADVAPQVSKHRFPNSATQLCLTNLGGGDVDTTGCATSPIVNRQWLWAGTIGSTGTIKSAVDGTCLDSFFGVSLLPCDGTPSQRWTVFRPAAGGLPLLVDGYNHCLRDFFNDDVEMDLCDNSSSYQRWRIVL